MTPGALLAAMILIWTGLLAGLWWVAIRVEETERRLQTSRGGLRGVERRG
ncbi:MAG: hypothetical protein ACRDIC_03190 [bacterium]